MSAPTVSSASSGSGDQTAVSEDATAFPWLRLWLIRHAPALVPPGSIAGALDAAAACGDQLKFQQLARRLPGEVVGLWTSDLQRTGQTAAALRMAGACLPAARTIPALREQNFGDWEGRSWAGLGLEDPLAAAFWADPAQACPPGGESFAAVCGRVAAVLPGLCAEQGAAAGPAAVAGGFDLVAVLHAGSIRAALALALDLTPAAALRIEIAPLSLTRIDWLGVAGWRVGGVNLLPEA